MDAIPPIDREVALRQELKLWEAAFAAQHDGRAPTRDEIKLAGGDIASKYKDYHRLRQRLADPPAGSATADLKDTTPSKRRRRDQPVTTPKKHSSHRSETYRDGTSIVSAAPEEITAAMPQRRLFVGPTPQKDGLALSLFDVLPLVETPSRRGRATHSNYNIIARTALAPMHDNAVFVTPSKRPTSASASTCASASRLSYHPTACPASPSTTHKHSRTPQTPGTRNFLSSFVTPSKRPVDPGAPSPGTLHADRRATSPSLFATPAFLRRDSRRLSLSEDDAAAGEDDSTAAATVTCVAGVVGTPPTSTRLPRRTAALKRRSFCRSLSSLIAEARAAEEARFEDEVAAMREVEQECPEEGGSAAAAAPAAIGRLANEARVPHVEPEDVVPETRAGLLGPDGVAAEIEADAASSAGEERGAGRARAWKKRGAKRQHRKVVLRPTVTKPPAPPPPPPDTHDSKSCESVDPASASDHDTDADADAATATIVTKEKKKKTHKPKTAMSSEHAAEEAAKAACRATKHTNFRRLKIRGNVKADTRKSGGFRSGKGAKGRR